MSCSYDPGFAIASNITYAFFEASSKQNIICPATYIRPDPGGSMMPWLYTLMLLVFHIPSVLIRVVRWESAQYLALGLAIFGIAFTVQSYASTKLQPDLILVWMPLTLIQDVGAMLQLPILILEQKDYSVRVLWNSIKDFFTKFGQMSEQDKKYFRHALVAITSFILGNMLLVLQLLGLIYAITGRRQTGLKARWCSPAFRDFAVAAITGNCELFPIVERSSSNGIGCIELPVQREWLTGTIIGLVLALSCQLADLVLLLLVNEKRKCRGGVRMKRPWFTMFGGVITLIILIHYSTEMANRLPRRVTESMWIYRKDPYATAGKVCQTHLWSPGLRGTKIAYDDGILGSWSRAYYGTP